MATNNYTAINANGVTYALTYVPGSGLTGDSYSLVVTYPNAATSTYTDIPPADVLTSSGGTLTLASVAGLLGGTTYAIPPGVNGTITTGVGVLAGQTVNIGGTATFTAGSSVLTGVTVNVDGGAALLSTDAIASLLSGATINLDNGGVFSNGPGLLTALSGATITFGAGGGTFIANGGGSAIDLSQTTINGFNAATDTLSFVGLPPGTTVANYSISDAGAGQTIVATDASGATLFDVTINSQNFSAGTYSATGAGPLTIVANANGTINLEATPSSSVCFLRGTLISTPDGDVRVETLAAGDLVFALDGARRVAREVVWTGFSRMDATACTSGSAAYPIRIRRDAFALGSPSRDLMVTPEHCVWTDHGLTPARMLVNGASIEVARDLPIYDFFHVELARHSLLIAENLAVESYLDTGNRATLCGAGLPTLQTAPLPLATTREQVEPVWQRLAERAAALGYVAVGGPAAANVTEQPDLRVLLDTGMVVDGEWLDGQRQLFRIPRDAAPLRLISRSAIPAEFIGPFVDDRRQLGVAVDEMVLSQGSNGPARVYTARDFDLPGWHGLEGDRRWTNGNALLGMPASTAGALLEVHVVGTARYVAAQT